MGQYDALLKPLEIKHLTVRNRFLSTSHQPAYNEQGNPSERYIRYQEEKARGGIGIAQCGGATGIAPENSAHYGQIDASRDAVIPHFKKLSDRLREHGAVSTIQLTHGGRRERWDLSNWLPAYAPSPRREPVHRSFPKEMEAYDIRRVRDCYAQAVRRCKEGGIDAVEVTCASQTLIEQFWSPAVNKRADEYGGSLENRMRFGFEVLEAARREVGEDYVIGIRMTGDEMTEGGLGPAECVEIARAYAASGLIDFISVIGGVPSDYVSTAKVWPSMWLPSGAYLHLASAIKAEVDIPIFHATRITDLATAARAVEEGHLDMVGMTKAFIADPHFPAKLLAGREDDIRECVGASYCVDRVLMGHDTVCVQNAATGREETMPHVVPKAANGKRRVVVAGAGPGGLEAARVSAERGHEVVLFEREAETGGQLGIASRVAWREPLSGITRWLDGQVGKLGVDLRLGQEATAEAVLAENPDVVVIATGGTPNKGYFEGTELCSTTWDVLAGRVEPAENVLVYDDQGAQQGPVCAEFMAERGSKVEIMTPDRALLVEVGETSFPAHMAELFKRGVIVTADTRLIAVKREGNKLVAVLRNEFAQAMEEERVVDQVVAEHGTLPNEDLYLALKPLSCNLGELDQRALIAGAPQAIATNPEGAFQLFRVGDALASRNIHTAIYDSLRLCKDL